MKWIAASVLFFLACASVQAQTTVPEIAEPDARDADQGQAINRKVDPDAYSILSTARGVTAHKANFVYPATYSDDYHGRQTEVIGQFSGKWRVFGSDFYLAYSQKSLWEYLNTKESSPFRETNYDPEAFYRFVPDPKRWNHWAADIGFEHESDGQGFTPPDPVTGLPTNKSRSWNRIYVAPFQAKGAYLAYLKFWYRVPEGTPSSVTHENGDDNPDIGHYMGNAELTFSRQIGHEQLLNAMLRGHPDGRGAVQLTWIIPSSEGWVFWGVSVFHGYGETLLSYNQEITRVMVGVLLAR